LCILYKNSEIDYAVDYDEVVLSSGGRKYNLAAQFVSVLPDFHRIIASALAVLGVQLQGG